MFNIQKYLEKFSKNIESNEFHKEQIIDILNSELKIQFLPEDIEIKNYILNIKCSPAIKNKLFIYKGKILEEISKIKNIKVIDIK